MKILRLIASMDPLTGGPCQGIRNSITELAKTGVHNEVVCLDAPMAPFLGKDSFIIHALGPGKSPWHYSAKLIPWLTANLLRFDVLIVHGLWLFPSYAAHIARQKVNKQASKNSELKLPGLFIMPHGMLDPYFQEATSRRLKSLRNWLYWNLIENKVIRDADGILFTSLTELMLARQSFSPYQPRQEINVGYGIQPPPTYSATMQTAFAEHCPILNGAPYLLFMGRIHKKKGVDLLIQAYAEIIKQKRRTSPSPPKLVIAGPGLDTAYGKEIQKIVAEAADLKDRVLFPGMLSGSAKWGGLFGCEALVLPSHQENFGIVVAEALACGKPVLISNQVNIWREIEAGEGGLVADNTLIGTQRLLEQWLTFTPDNKKTMGEKAKSTFERHFAIKQVVNRFVEAIKAAENLPK
jgi:glycosyltransferase involved in cell wall biosynthesis